MGGKKVKVVEKDSGTFAVSSLVPGTKYEIKVTTKNKQGSSKPVYLAVETFLLPSELIAETKVKKDNSSDDQHIFVVQVTVTCFSMLVMAVMLVIIFLRLRTRNNIESPVVKMTLLHKKHSTEHETLTTHLGCDGPFLGMPDNRITSEVMRHFMNKQIALEQINTGS
jgi:hypothetical protein